MSKKLFVGNLSWDTTDASLSEFFAAVGKVITATIIKDRNTGRSKGFGFVEFETEEDAQKALNELNGKELDGRTIVVNEARPQEKRESNFGGGGNFRGGNRNDNRGRRDFDKRNRF